MKSEIITTGLCAAGVTFAAGASVAGVMGHFVSVVVLFALTVASFGAAIMERD